MQRVSSYRRFMEDLYTRDRASCAGGGSGAMREVRLQGHEHHDDDDDDQIARSSEQPKPLGSTLIRGIPLRQRQRRGLSEFSL
jgi:hypothetical protein